jgi:Iron-containing redox enzyme
VASCSATCQVQLAPGMGTGESERLRRKIALPLPSLIEVGQRLFTHPRITDLYPEYLVTLHWIVRASVPLMEAARAQAETMAKDDPVSAELAPYLAEHITEEMHHDEWLLNDLEALGRDRPTVIARPPSATVAAFVGAQYYWIFHYHPVALLGYIALLEGYPPSREQIEALIARTGYSPKAFRTLLAHADLDPHHREVLDEKLDALPLAKEHSTVLGLSAMYSAYTLAQAIDEIADRTG